MKVEPIRDQRDIERIEDMLFALGTPHGNRMFAMFETGIYLGMRIGDMLQLKVGDIRGKDYYKFIPQKTDEYKNKLNYKAKEVVVTIPPELRNMVNHMYKGQPDSAPLFPSRQRRPGSKEFLPITRKTAFEDMRIIAGMAKLPYRIGCHTLRKTFGYQVYKQRKDIAWLQKWFQHSDPATTLIYIGISDDEKKAVTDNMPYKNRGRFDWREKEA